MGVPGWSRSPHANGSIDTGVSALDGAAARSFPSSLRSVMAAVRQQADATGGALVTSGILNAYVVTGAGLTELRPGIALIVKADRDNTAAPTLSVDGLGPLPWLDAGGAPLPAGRILAGRFYSVLLDSDVPAWRVQSGALTLGEIPGLIEARDQVAENAASASQNAAAAVTASEAAVASAAQVALDSAQVATRAFQIATDRTAVAGDRAAADAARDEALAFRNQAQATVGSGRVQKDTLALLNAARNYPEGTIAEVLADPGPVTATTGNGYYAKVGDSGAGSWVKKSDATVPGVDGKVAAERSDREALIRTGRIVIPDFGDVDEATLHVSGRVVSARRGTNRLQSSLTGLFPQSQTTTRVVVPGLGDVASADIDKAGRVSSAIKGINRLKATDVGLLPESQARRVVIPGVGDVHESVQDTAGRVAAASKGNTRLEATDVGLLPQATTFARTVVPGYGDVQVVSRDFAGRVNALEVGGVTFSPSRGGNLVSSRRAAAGTDFDVLIYGGTLSGLMAAVRAALRGLSVAIVEPTAQTGGVISQGLTYTDYPMYGQTGLVGGLTRQVFNSIADEYGRPRPMWLFEPKAFDTVFNRILIQTGARVIERSPIDAPRDVSVRAGRIEGVRTREGWLSCGVAIDASYEMDLGRFAGAPWRMGRESTAEFGEPMAGFRTSWGYFRDSVTPNNKYPVKTRPAFAEGDADGLIQPYSFRTILTNAPDRIPYPQPAGGYDTALADMVVAIVLDHGSTNFADYVSLPIVSPPGAPYLKACINAPRLIGIELPGEQQAYPLATWKRRREIVEIHRRWELNLLYCLANDPRIPAALRASANLWGFPADEWTNGETRGFPDWLYVREALRLRGAYTMTEFDMWLLSNPLNTSGGARHSLKSDVIARWAYFKDAHSMALFSEGAGIRATGNSNPAEHDVDPYDMPYRSLHTDPALASHISNLLVSLCFSTTSVSWMASRMEPLFGMTGEAAGEAAALMLGLGLPVENVPYPILAERLRALGSVF